MYEQGKGCIPDEQRAFQIYAKCADKDNTLGKSIIILYFSRN